MKKNLLLLTAFASLAFATLWAQSTIPDPELLYYKFNESGTTVTNYATNPPVGTATATLMGALTQGSTGQCDGAVIGSGAASSTDYVNTGWATELSSTSWTISFWSNNIGTTSTLYYVFGDASAGSFRCFTNGVAGSGNWILRGTFTDVLATGGAPVSGPSLTTFVYDMTLNNIKAYVNGALVNTVAQGAVPITGTGPFKVVGYGSNVGMSSGGLVDEFRLYNRALSDIEVMQLFTRNTIDTVNIVACTNPYTSPSGNFSWTTPGTYNDTIPNAFCGDSLMTINLTFSQPDADTIDVVACDSYESPSGNFTWTTSGTYTDTLTTVFGCDSVLTINLTVNASSVDTITVSACDSYESPSGNFTWTTSGIYNDTIPNAAGCDSLLTINLTVGTSTADTIDVATCDSYESPSGNYMWTSSGTYNDTIPNAANCDSLLTINLTITNSTNASQTVSACDAYLAEDGITYTQSGSYDVIIPNAAGCDSIIALDLTIDNIDTNVTFNGTVLTSATAGADAYQWIDCTTGDTIPGATAATYTVTQNGSYAVMIVNGTCSQQSECITITDLNTAELSHALVNVFPNPVSDVLTVRNDNGYQLSLQLFDLNGTLVWEQQHNASEITVEMKSLARGVYTLSVQHANAVQLVKIVRN